MKRVVLTIVLFMTFLTANATLMQKVYHKDYGVIDRTVLVFNRTLDFKIDHHENLVEILLPNCSRDEVRVTNEFFTSSNVLKSYTYRQEGNNLLMIILLNDSYTTVNHSNFSVEYLSYQKDVYKIALDIFATQNPVSNEELLSFVNFYTTMDQTQKAKIYKEKLTQKIEKDKRDAAEKPAQKIDSVQAETKPLKKETVPLTTTTLKKDIKIYLIPILLILLVGLVIWLIVHILRQGKKVEEITPQDMKPVGRQEFRTRVIRKLLDHDWHKRAISLELKVPLSEVEEVEKQYQLERANQLNNDEIDAPEKPLDIPEIPVPILEDEHLLELENEHLPESGDGTEEIIQPEIIVETTTDKNIDAKDTATKNSTNEDFTNENYANENSADKDSEEIEVIEKPETETETELELELENENKGISPEKYDAEEQEKIEEDLNPGEVIRESDEADEPEIDESLKEMLAYDSSDKDKSRMNPILDDMTFTANDIEEIIQDNDSTHSEDDTENDSDLPNKEIEHSNNVRHESDMSKMLRKRFPKTNNESESDEIVDKAEDLPKDPDELLEKAITNKLDELTKKPTPPVE